MTVIARWGSYKWAKWEITRKKLFSYSSASMSREWVEKQKKKKAHQGPVEFTFKFPVYKELTGINIGQYLQRWNTKVGKIAAFYLGDWSVGIAKKYRLTGVDVSNIEQVNDVIVSCIVELTFTSTKKKTKKKKRLNKVTTKKSSKKKKKKKK